MVEGRIDDEILERARGTVMHNLARLKRDASLRDHEFTRSGTEGPWRSVLDALQEITPDDLVRQARGLMTQKAALAMKGPLAGVVDLAAVQAMLPANEAAHAEASGPAGQGPHNGADKSLPERAGCAM
jgi:hypothetical protein